MSLTKGTVAMVQCSQTKDAMRARIIVATVPQAFTGLFPQRPNGGCSHHSLEGRFLFAFVRGSNRFSTTWPTIETDAAHYGYGACATRVQGAFQRCVQSVSGPSLLRAQTDHPVETGATVNPSLTVPNRDQEGKRRSESCAIQILKGARNELLALRRPYDGDRPYSRHANPRDH